LLSGNNLIQRRQVLYSRFGDFPTNFARASVYLRVGVLEACLDLIYPMHVGNSLPVQFFVSSCLVFS